MGSIAIVLAANSDRFGPSRLRANVSGEPVLNRTIASLRNGGVDRVVVVFDPDSAQVAPLIPALDGGHNTFVIDATPATPLHPLQVGLRAAAEGDPVVVIPADMPFVTSGAVATLLDAYRRNPVIVAPVYYGDRGFPILVPPAVQREILATDSREGLDAVLAKHVRVDVDVADAGVLQHADHVAVGAT